MKNKGRRHKRAIAALKKIHMDKYGTFSKGYVVCTSKSHPNYFKAMLWDKYEEAWVACYCSYISSYMDDYGNFVRV